MKATTLKSKALLASASLATLFLMFATIIILFGYEDLDSFQIKKAQVVSIRMILAIIAIAFATPHIIVIIETKISTHYNWKRLTIEFLSLIVFAAIVAVVLTSMFSLENEYLSGPPIPPTARLFLFNIVVGTVFFAVNEVLFNMERNQSLERSISSLEKEQMSLKLNVLQQRLDPHFMFNSLNVLSELVHEDSNKADRFISQFAKVYRYVLELNKDSLVSLEQELDFLESYEYLLEIRMGNTLQIDKANFSSYNMQLIPPLSLQLLLENAIKHNAASKDKPLQIELFYESDMIVMKNNKRIRTSTDSSGFGLIKLMDTYKLLGAKDPIIMEDEHSFTVKLPLIKSEL